MDTNAGGQTDRRKGRRFHLAGARLGKQISGLAARRGFAEPEVLLRWPEIAGAHMAALCRPVSVRYGRGQALGATLTVAAVPARSVEVQHLAPRLMEAVNRFYGYRAVTRIAIDQRVEADTPAPGPRPPGAPTPSEKTRAEAARLTAHIADPDLRTALAQMGAYVLERARRTRPPAETDEKECDR